MDLKRCRTVVNSWTWQERTRGAQKRHSGRSVRRNRTHPRQARQAVRRQARDSRRPRQNRSPGAATNPMAGKPKSRAAHRRPAYDHPAPKRNIMRRPRPPCLPRPPRSAPSPAMLRVAPILRSDMVSRSSSGPSEADGGFAGPPRLRRAARPWPPTYATLRWPPSSLKWPGTPHLIGGHRAALLCGVFIEPKPASKWSGSRVSLRRGQMRPAHAFNHRDVTAQQRLD